MCKVSSRFILSILSSMIGLFSSIRNTYQAQQWSELFPPRVYPVNIFFLDISPTLTIACLEPLQGASYIGLLNKMYALIFSPIEHTAQWHVSMSSLSMTHLLSTDHCFRIILVDSTFAKGI